MKVFRHSVIIICSIFAFYSCSSKGELQVQSNLDAGIDHQATAALSVQPDDRIEKTEAVAVAVGRLREQLFGRLVSEGVFAQVVQPGGEAQYDVRVRLLTAKEVSQGARILFGVLAGPNELAVLVEVFDTTNQARVGAFTAKGKSASHPLSSENDMDDAIREAVDKVIFELKN